MTQCQDYEVADVKCVMETIGPSGGNQRLFARLRKPENFRGHPLFADDPQINPFKHELCQILPDPIDLTGRIYRLDIKDFSRCGVTHHGVSLVTIIFQLIIFFLPFKFVYLLFQFISSVDFPIVHSYNQSFHWHLFIHSYNIFKNAKIVQLSCRWFEWFGYDRYQRNTRLQSTF